MQILETGAIKLEKSSALLKSNKPINRKLLQKYSDLKNLSTRMIRDDNYPHDMLIPGGMTLKESLLYKLTGKFPKSVTERWKQVFEPEIKNVDSKDEVIRVSKNVLRETGYFSSHNDIDSTVDDLTDNVDNVSSNIGKIAFGMKKGFKNFIDDIIDRVDDIL